MGPRDFLGQPSSKKILEIAESSSLCITFGAIILGLELLWFKDNRN
jgi:hypothetical protein